VPIYSVSQITHYLRETLERDALLADLWVSGEVSNFVRAASGHMYFTLKDPDAQVRCVMFRDSANGVEALVNGAAVTAHGRLSLYEVRGDLQLYTDMVRPEGLGKLHLELERLKARLEAEGLFAPDRKRPIPLFPRRIGVITSPTGAVWHDIQTVIERRYPLVELVLAPCQVQGDNAAPSILEAFQLLKEEPDIDTIILARGGGSLEELWAFNTEPVARAIYGSASPVVSAVGHETDVTVADMVADLRAPTPSAAAELAVPDLRELRSRVLASGYTLSQGAMTGVEAKRASVERLERQVEARRPDVVTRRQRVDDVLHGATLRIQSALALSRERLLSLEGRLVSLDPAAVLQRGYAIVQHGTTGSAVHSVAQLSAGDPITVQVADGAFGARVTDPALDNRRQTL
jgi:exodeoxyribonuclease VII large subunit